MTRTRILRMEKVRDLRQRELDRASVRLADAHKAEARARQQLDEAIVKERDASAKRLALRAGASAVVDWAQTELWLQSVQAEVVRDRQALAATEQDVDLAKKVVLQARTHVERIEHLIHRYRSEMAKDAATADRKLEDELAGRHPMTR